MKNVVPQSSTEIWFFIANSNARRIFSQRISSHFLGFYYILSFETTSLPIGKIQSRLFDERFLGISDRLYCMLKGKEHVLNVPSFTWLVLLHSRLIDIKCRCRCHLRRFLRCAFPSTFFCYSPCIHTRFVVCFSIFSIFPRTFDSISSDVRFFSSFAMLKKCMHTYKHTGNAEEEEGKARKNKMEEEKERMKGERWRKSDVQWTQIFCTHQHMSDWMLLFFLSSFFRLLRLNVCHFVSSSQAFLLCSFYWFGSRLALRQMCFGERFSSLCKMHSLHAHSHVVRIVNRSNRIARRRERSQNGIEEQRAKKRRKKTIGKKHRRNNTHTVFRMWLIPVCIRFDFFAQKSNINGRRKKSHSESESKKKTRWKRMDGVKNKPNRKETHTRNVYFRYSLSFLLVAAAFTIMCLLFNLVFICLL